MDKLAKHDLTGLSEVGSIAVVDLGAIVKAVVEEIWEKGGRAHILAWRLSLPFRYANRHRLEVIPQGISFSPFGIARLKPSASRSGRLKRFNGS